MSTLISFRLTDNEAELLSRLQENDESLSLAAARLLREKLGLSSVNTQLTEQLTSLEDLINDIVNERLTAVNNSMVELIDKAVTSKMKEAQINIEELKARIFILETPPKKTTKKPRKTSSAAGVKEQGEIGF